jgi:8-oxo-dGTP pyrophosphatase MutT (NUDIX family)
VDAGEQAQNAGGEDMSDYIMGLRKIVGHRPLMLVGASVLVVDSRNRILLQQRRDNGCWGYAGGSVELYERVEDAARRELLEETGLTAQTLTLYGVFSGPESHYVYPNGDEVSCVDIVYVCRDYAGTLTPQENEVMALEFFAPDQLPDNLSPPVARVIRQFARDLMHQEAP